MNDKPDNEYDESDAMRELEMLIRFREQEEPDGEARDPRNLPSIAASDAQPR